MATVQAIMDALADQIEGQLASEVEGLQVDPGLLPNPTPPSIDIYPAETFVEGLGFGAGNYALFFTVRARLNTPDADGSQDVLLSMMDPTASSSLVQAVMSDPTLSGTVENLTFEPAGPTGYGVFQDAAGQGQYLGCTWTVKVNP